MIEIKEHLATNIIHRYKNLQLLPTEILAVDDHLSVCEYCRFRTQQTDALDELYQSFIEGEIAEKSGFSFASFGVSNWFNFTKKINRLAFAAALIFLCIISISYFYFNQNNPTEITFINQTEPTNKIQNSEPILQKTRNSDEINIEKKSDSSQKTNKKIVNLKPQKNNLPNQNQLNFQKSVKLKENNSNLNIDVTKIESDSSKEMGSESQTTVENLSNLQINKVNDKFFVKVEANKKAVSYQYFLAESPNLATISKEKSANNRWQIPHNKLVKGKSYILQITVIKDDNKTEIIQKQLVLVKKTKKVGNENGNNKQSDKFK